MSQTNPTREPTSAQVMEAQESALVKQERCDAYLDRQVAPAEAMPVSVPEQPAIHPDVQLNTDEISECHEPTTADEMEAEERELVIEDSVDDVRTYAQKPLSDEEIRQQALTRLDQIDPNPKDGNHC